MTGLYEGAMELIEAHASLLRGLLFLVLLGVGLAAERFWPLRVQTQPKLRRIAANLGLALLSSAALRLFALPILLTVAAVITERGWGVIQMLRLPRYAEVLLGLILLDYTLYLWHWMNHRIRFLWRFHNVHHVDLDLDTSTAARFHFGEIMLSAFFRSAQIVVLGVDWWMVLIFEALVTSFAQFHHCNVRLHLQFERILCKAIVTPRMHGIHHSIVEGETNSNFSTIFSIWDRLHGTLRLNIPQSQITIGVPGYREPGEISFANALVLPFRHLRPWRLSDGSYPARREGRSACAGASGVSPFNLAP
ncbi:MAG: sterol desaturase family protein [Gammaproteobacteria bacterium]